MIYEFCASMVTDYLDFYVFFYSGQNFYLLMGRLGEVGSMCQIYGDGQ